MLDFERFEWLSFDCYGTLVDWETGISDAVANALDAHDIRMSKSEILALFAEVEPQIQQGGRYLEYRRVLRRVVAMMGIKLDVQFSESEMNCLVNTIGSWPVFHDTRDALRAMKSRYNLAIISNVDDDLFAPTAEALEVELDVVVTAQQCGSYKPDHRNFRIALERMGIQKGRWLHIGESLYHDIAPANELGIASVWVNRGHGQEGGATRPTDAKPDMEFHDLASLVRAMG
ncbi:MAG: HAD-IA family hydrolase, partial [Dehalococcoidia bacterium]|nr:HAD-IA family hydrolase [Dehalococcoidia bacterium]